MTGACKVRVGRDRFSLFGGVRMTRWRGRIQRYEYLPLERLMTLIQGARAVLFPSIYEGFGLPILEAMTLGTPVITSTTSSTPEVAGDAAILKVDPKKASDVVTAFKGL